VTDYFSGAVGLIFFVIMGAVVLLWIILPFAVFGIKDRLDRVVRILERLYGSGS
jgi:hypothetical protein